MAISLRPSRCSCLAVNVCLFLQAVKWFSWGPTKQKSVLITHPPLWAHTPSPYVLFPTNSDGVAFTSVVRGEPGDA